LIKDNYWLEKSDKDILTKVIKVKT